MKAIIGRTAGVLGLGAALLLTGCREASSVASAATMPAGTVVNCGEGRQALLRPVTVGSGAAQVDCVAIADAQPYTLAYQPGAAAPVVNREPAPAPVRERVVYRSSAPEREVSRAPDVEPAAYPDRSADRGGVYSDRSADRGGVYSDRSTGQSTPVNRTPPAEPQRQTRSWKKSAIIVGGAAAGGAGLGAIIGGGGGAKKGAVIGGVAGVIYDIATRNK